MQITVAQMIETLSKLPQDLPVRVEVDYDGGEMTALATGTVSEILLQHDAVVLQA